jgi:hypothetical protein
MKHRLAPAHLANHLHLPVRFGSALRGYEPLLRIGQLVLLLWLAVSGAKLLAQALMQGFRMLAAMP